MAIEINEIYNEDCIEGAKRIAPESVDLILTDPPYGNMNTDGGRNLGIRGWDFIIDPNDIYSTAKRILRKNGRMVLFSQEPYTSQLITSASPSLPFSYRAIWEKDNFANPLGVNKAMVGLYEDILLFKKPFPKYDFEKAHPLRSYFKDVFEYINAPVKEIADTIENTTVSHYFTNGVQFSMPTEESHDKLIEHYNINEMDGFISFDGLKEIHERFMKQQKHKNSNYNHELPSTFNLWEGKKFKSNILKYKKDYTGHHPTQKPVALLEDLIKTYSNEGDTVVDLTIGSGSTAIACLNTGRNFIGFELDEGYYKTALARIEAHRKDEPTWKHQPTTPQA